MKKPDSKTSKAASRAANRTQDKPTVTKPVPQPLPGLSRRRSAILTFRASGAPTPTQGAIKLSFPLTPLATTAMLHNIGDGINGNLNYPDFEAWRAALAAQEAALISTMDDVTTAEQAAKVARSARDLEVLNAEAMLRDVAIACEAVDRRDEALLSANWTLRRPAGGPKPLPAPARLVMKNLPYEGTVQIRWGAVANKQYYEIKALVGGENLDPSLWTALPSISEGRVSHILSDLAVGSYVTVRVRAIGAKGPSPWTEAVTLRVN